MRQLLGILFLIVFSFQVLPVRTIGKLLSKGQTEEEVKHSCDSADDDFGSTGKYGDVNMIGHASCHYFPESRFIVKDKITNRHYADDLPTPHVADIPSPPPNC